MCPSTAEPTTRPLLGEGFDAIRAGYVDALEALLDRGLEVDAQDAFQRTMLYIAARQNRPAALALLLSRGARHDLCITRDPELSRWRERTPDELAAVGAAWQRFGASLKVPLGEPRADGPANASAAAGACGATGGTGATGAISIDEAARRQLARLLDTTLAAAGEVGSGTAERMVEENDFRGLDALGIACALGNSECARMLIDAGADPRRRSTDGREPLHFAAMYGHAHTVGLLLSSGVPVDARVATASSRRPGRNALSFAVRADHEDVVAVLLDHGADPNAVGTERLYQALVDGDARTVGRMLAAGVPADGETSDGIPLVTAAFDGDPAALEMLRAAGAPVTVEWLFAGITLGRRALVDLALVHLSAPWEMSRARLRECRRRAAELGWTDVWQAVGSALASRRSPRRAG